MVTIITNPTTSQISFQDTISGIRITFLGRQGWGRFIKALAEILFYLLIMAIAVARYLDYSRKGQSPFSPDGILLALIFIFMFIMCIYHSIHLMETKLYLETILIDGQSVTIDRSGFMDIKRHVSIPATDIRSIGEGRHSGRRVLKINLQAGSPDQWLARLKTSIGQTFCLGICDIDAAAALVKIHERFPKYREIKQGGVSEEPWRSHSTG
jgi:hypothetical protein